METWQVGEQVVVDDNGLQLDTIIRITKTMIVLDSGRRVNINSLSSVGDIWHHYWVKKATPELIAQINETEKRLKLRRIIKDFDMRKLTTAQLESIVNILEGK
jgi:hypothetical protein